MPENGIRLDGREASAVTRLRPPDDVFWSVELRGVRLYQPGRAWSVFLEYPRAAVWEMAVRGQNGPGLAAKIALIGGIDLLQARRLVADCLVEWRREGILIAS